MVWILFPEVMLDEGLKIFSMRVTPCKTSTFVTKIRPNENFVANISWHWCQCNTSPMNYSHQSLLMAERVCCLSCSVQSLDSPDRFRENSGSGIFAEPEKYPGFSS